MRTLYFAHPGTREYIGRANKKNGATFAHGFKDAPAHVAAGEPVADGKACLRTEDGSAWTLVDDNRGTYYSTEDQTQTIVDVIGDPAPENATLKEPPSSAHVWDGADWAEPEPTLLEAQSAKMILLRMQLGACKFADFDYGGHTYPVSPTDRDYFTSLTDLVSLTGLASVTLRTAAGVLQDFTDAEFSAFTTALKARDLALMTAYNAKAAELSALGTIAEVDAYDLTTGWP